jgi:hypothetical protein
MITHVLLLQRAWLHSLAFAYSTILVLIPVGSAKKMRAKPFMVAGIIVAARPHSIIACVEWDLIFAIMSIVPFSQKRFQALMSSFLIIAAIAILISVPQMTTDCKPFKKGFRRVARIWTAGHASPLTQV